MNNCAIKKHHKISAVRCLLIVGAAMVAAGIMCILIKAVLPEYIDEAGFLHEHFFLLPVGFTGMIAGVMTFAAAGIVQLMHLKK